MKKLLAASVLFAVLSAGAFAQLTVSGSVGAAATTAKGSNVVVDGVREEIHTDSYLTGSIEATAADELGLFGGTVKLSGEISSVPHLYVTDYDLIPKLWDWTASAWWQPIYQVRVQFGVVDAFALTDIVGWGYHANDAEEYVVAAKSNYAGDWFSQTTGFFSGTGLSWTGLTLTLTPVYGINVNIGIPFGFKDENGTIVQNPKAKDVYLNSTVQASYDFYGVGRLALGFAGAGDGSVELGEGGDALKDPGVTFNLSDIAKTHAPSLYASFLLTALQGSMLSVNAGFAYTLPAKTDDGKIVYNAPMEAGLGVAWGTESYGVKLRTAAIFGGNVTRSGSSTLREPLKVGLGILPYISYKVCTFYLNTGVAYKFQDEYMDEAAGNQVIKVGNSEALGWFVNPYVTVTMGSGKVYAGLKVECDGLKYVGADRQNIAQTDTIVNGEMPGVAIINWGIPIGIQFDF